MTEIKDWERKHFESPLYDASIFFVVYGGFTVDFNVSGEKYQTKGIPDGIELMSYDRDTNPAVLKSFLDGYVWENVKITDPVFANEISSADQCYVFRGDVADSNSLNYYRDLVGLMTYLLDNGGVAVYDIQILTFWKKNDWINKIFKPHVPLSLLAFSSCGLCIYIAVFCVMLGFCFSSNIA